MSPIMPGLVLFPVVVIIINKIVRYLAGKYLPIQSNRNNAAFLCIQVGLYERALQILDKDILETGASPINLANFAVALHFTGEGSAAEKYFKATEWWAQSKRDKAVVSYGQFLVSLEKNDLVQGKKFLQDALSWDRQEVRRYCALNEMVQAHLRASLELESTLISKT